MVTKANSKIKFGPAGLGPVKDAIKHLEEYSELGLRACEISFTYGTNKKKEADMKEIRNAAEKYGIKLSIHAPYWINLNSKEKIKIEQSKQRILRSCVPASLKKAPTTMLSLCSLDIFANSGETHRAARTLGTLFATMDMPIPVVQISTPRSASPRPTCNATSRAKSG